MKAGPGRMAGEYRAALDAFLAEGGEKALARAYALGRDALARDVGVLDVLAIHHGALGAILAAAASPAEVARALEAAQNFLSEAMSPYEMTHRGFREANVALRRLNERLEDESKRLARVVHDDLGAMLVTLQLSCRNLEPHVAPSGHAAQARMRADLIELGERLRDVSHEIRPTILDDLGLLPALRILAEGVAARGNLDVEVLGEFRRDLPTIVQKAAYRIVQEALSNVVRHASATRAIVRLGDRGGVLRCSVRDNGVGVRWPLEESGRRNGAGLGLLGIRERLDELGGGLVIDSRPGRGLRLVASIPLEGRWRTSA